MTPTKADREKAQKIMAGSGHWASEKREKYEVSIAQALADQREECAKIAENNKHHQSMNCFMCGTCDTCKRIATAIRKGRV